MQTKAKAVKIAACVAIASAIFTLCVVAIVQRERSAAHSLKAQPTASAVTSLVPSGAPARLDRTSVYGKLPLAFEANQGQAPSDVRFLSRGSGYSLFLTGEEAVLALRQPGSSASHRLDRTKSGKFRNQTRGAEKLAVLRMRLDGSNPNSTVAGLNRTPTRINYFIGNDPQKWHTDIPAYERVRYQAVYPGIDLLFYGNQRRLEYDFSVAPGADAKAIVLDIEGANKFKIDARGNLLLTVAGGEVELQKPVIYQEFNGGRREIAGNYAITNDHEIRFSIPNYDSTRTLTIDPVLNYVTYLGGTGSDEAFGIALDASQDAYVAGVTTSTDFPQVNAEPATPPADIATNGTAFISELNPTGTQLLYSTYLGGTGETNTGDAALAIAVDGSGNIYVTGFTGSPDFPTTTTGLIPTAPGNSSGLGTGFITKLIPANTGTAQLGYSSYLGGSTQDQGNGIAVDSSGNAYVAGLTLSTDFPTTPNAISTALLNPNGSAFLTEINTLATTGPASKVYSTYFGGTLGAGNAFLFGDNAMGVTVDSSSNAYIVGTTTSSDFPTTAHFVSSCLTDTNGIAFVSVINTATPAMTFSTCLGGATTQTQGVGIALGPNSIVYVTGETSSTDFPVTANSIPAAAGVTNGVAFVSLLNTGSATPNQYSTFLGGNGGDAGFGIAADATGIAYVTGGTGSPNFPVTQGAILRTLKNLNGTGFVAKISPSGNGKADLLYSSYFGGSGNGTVNDVSNGIALSPTNNAYIAGQTSSSDLPVTQGVFQPTLTSTTMNAFVAELPLLPNISVAPTSLNFGLQLVGASSQPQFVTLTNNTSSPVGITLPPTTSGPDFSGVAGGTSPCATPLAVAASCTIAVTFAPATSGVKSETLNIVDAVDGPTQPIQVALSGTGSANAPNISLTPTSLTLPGALLTTTSGPQSVSIGNNGNLPLSIASIATGTTAFAETANTAACNNGTFPIVIAPGGTPCAVSVTFTPSATTTPGPVSDTLTIKQTLGNVNTVPLSATAWDFSVSAAAISVAKGATGSFPVVVTGLGGFTGAVAFTCTPGMLITSCSVPTTNAAPAPGATASGSITAMTFIVPPQSMKAPPSALLRLVVFIMMAIGLLLMLPEVRRLRTRLGMLGAMMVFVLVAGCSGGGGGGSKSSTLTITPSSGGVTKTAITVNVTITQ